ncbi:unnamed protein product [Coccothraustes coccothraustes]
MSFPPDAAAPDSSAERCRVRKESPLVSTISYPSSSPSPWGEDGGTRPTFAESYAPPAAAAAQHSPCSPPHTPIIPPCTPVPAAPKSPQPVYNPPDPNMPPHPDGPPLSSPPRSGQGPPGALAPPPAPTPHGPRPLGPRLRRCPRLCLGHAPCAAPGQRLCPGLYWAVQPSAAPYGPLAPRTLQYNSAQPITAQYRPI